MNTKILILLLLLLMPAVIFSQNFSTWGEIYDFEIGDIFHVQEKQIIEEDTLLVKSVIEITDKSFSGNLDTVFYLQYIQTFTYTSEFQEWVYESRYDTTAYTDLNSIYFADSIAYSDSYNGRKISYRSYTIKPFNDRVWYRHVDGCGWVYYYYHQHMAYDLEELLNLVYFRKGSEEWGKPFQFMAIQDFDDDPDFCMIFPNPSSYKIQIKSTIDLKLRKVQIFSNIGQLISTQLKNFDMIDISHLSPGLYNVKITGYDWTVVRKLIVK